MSQDRMIEIKGFNLNPKCTFEEFVVASHNKLAHAACLKVAEAQGSQYNPIFLYGPAGVGKTHLMQAVGHKILETHPKIQYLYTSAERLKGDIASALEEGVIRGLRDKYLSLDLFLLDDVQFLSEWQTAQVQFFHIFSDLLQQGKQVIMTSDRSPTQLIGMEERLRSRFEWGLNADIKPPDLEARVMILKRKQASEGLQISDEMLRFVAGKLQTNVRELEGFIRRMHAHVALAKEEITLSLMFSVIRDMAPSSPLEEAAPRVPVPVSVPAPPPSVQEETVPAAEPPVPIKEIPVVFLCPKVQAGQCQVVEKHFREIIEKHKLKFTLKNIHSEFYDDQDKTALNYYEFVQLCRAKGSQLAIVVGPPPGSAIPPQEFADNMQATFDAQGLSLELINWLELNKNYHYLNLALDIALVRQKG